MVVNSCYVVFVWLWLWWLCCSHLSWWAVVFVVAVGGSVAKVGGTRNRLPYVSQKRAQWRAQ